MFRQSIKLFCTGNKIPVKIPPSVSGKEAITDNRSKLNQITDFLLNSKNVYLSNNRNTNKIISGIAVIGGTTIGLSIYNWDKIKKVIGLESAKVAQETLKNNELVDTTKVFTKKVIMDSLMDPEVLEASKIYLGTLMKDKSVQYNLVELLNVALADENFKKQTLNFVSELLESKQIKDNVIFVLKDVIADPIIYAEVAKLVQNILDDPNLQNKSGQHLWNASKFAVTPNFIKSK